MHIVFVTKYRRRTLAPELLNYLLQWIGHQRFIYNAKVSEDRYYRVFAQKAVSLSGTAMSKSAALSLPCEWARQL